MASFTLTASPTFPPGSTIGVYRRLSFPGGRPSTGVDPGIPALQSVVVPSNGVATITGLLEGVQYVAGEQVNGVWRYIGFMIPEPLAQATIAELAVEATARASADSTEATNRAVAQAALEKRVGLSKVSLGNVSGNVTIDLAAGSLFLCTLTGNTTFSFVNAPANPYEWSVVYTQDEAGGHTVAWEGVEWVGEEPEPQLTGLESAVLSGMTYDTKNLGWGTAGASSAFVGTTTGAVTSFGVGAGPSTLVANTVYGVNAGHAITTGSLNVLEGGGAGEALTTGLETVAIGYYACQNGTTNTKSTYLGWAAGRRATGNEQVAIGFQAGEAATVGGGIFIGSFAGNNVTTGGGVIIGQFAGSALTTGGANIAIGANALHSATTSEKNVVIGTAAGEAATTAKESVLVGYHAGAKITIGQKNVMVGFEAGAENVEGNENVYVGSGAGFLHTGSGCVFLGRRAGREEIGSVYKPTESNVLLVANSPTEYLIHGNFTANSGELRLGRSPAGRMGFFGAPPVPRSAITGNHSTETALVLSRLLTALGAGGSGLGLIANETT